MTESGATPRPSRLGLFADNRRFRALSVALIASTFGDQVAAVGYVFVAFGVSGSVEAVSAVVLAQVIPYIVFGLLGGALSSILARRKLMVVVDVARVVIQALLGVLALSGSLTLSYLLAGVVLVSLGGSLFNPFARASLVEYVPAEKLVTANSMLAVGQNLSIVLAPLLAAVLASVSLSLFFFVDALTYLVSTGFLIQLLLREKQDRQVRGDALDSQPSAAWRTLPVDVRSALTRFYRLTRAGPVLLALYATTFATVIFNTCSWQVGLFLRLVPGAQGTRLNYSVALSVFAVVCVAANVRILKFVKSLTMTHYLAEVAVWGIGMIAVITLPVPGGVWVGVVVLAAGLTFASQARVFLIQTAVPLRDVGQAFSLSAVMLYLANAIGVAAYTPLEPIFSTGTLMGLSGVGLLLCVVDGYLLVPNRERR